MKNFGVSMLNSKVSNYFFVAMLIAITGCVSGGYRANKSNPSGTDIIVDPGRVIVQCEFIDNYSGDYKDPYGFMIHILDQENTVLTVSNGTVLEKRACFERLDAANRIIQKGRVIYVRGRGDAESLRKKQGPHYYFPKYGSFQYNGRSLNYLAIWNDKGQCYDAFYGAKKPCPRNE